MQSRRSWATVAAMSAGYGLYLHGLLPLIFAVMASFFLGISRRAWKHRRPFLISQRWIFGLVLLGFLPSIANPSLFTRHSASVPASLLVIQWMNPAMLLCVTAFIWFQLRGYLVFAVTEKSFREGFQAAAATLGYTVEESLASLRLMPAGISVRVSLQAWLGTGQVRADAKNRAVVAALAREMNAHYVAHGGETNQVTTAFYAVMGLFMVLMAIAMACLRLGR